MLSFVGLGLWDERDITVKGLEEVRNCDVAYAEFYTSKMGVGIERIEELAGKKIHVLSREEVEDGEWILHEAEKKHVCLLAGGDTMAATTHVDLRIRAVERGIPTRVVHGVSIVSAAAGLLGLQVYKFGKVVSIARPQPNFFPLSPYDAIRDNATMGMHSLLLLDTTGGYMTANEALELLLEMEERKKEHLICEDTPVAVVARVSSDDALARAGCLGEMMSLDFGDTPHSVVLFGKLHVMEIRALVTLAHAQEKIFKK